MSAPSSTKGVELVGAPGIEPGLNGPKPLVLPLYYAPNWKFSLNKRYSTLRPKWSHYQSLCSYTCSELENLHLTENSVPGTKMVTSQVTRHSHYTMLRIGALRLHEDSRVGPKWSLLKSTHAATYAPETTIPLCGRIVVLSFCCYFIRPET